MGCTAALNGTMAGKIALRRRAPVTTNTIAIRSFFGGNQHVEGVLVARFRARQDYLRSTSLFKTNLAGR